jgi:uroporphyrinogen III methyltransferase / synthase
VNANQKPLAGKRIVVTRAPKQAGELILELEKLGAEVLLLPTLSFAPPESWEKLDAELRRLDCFDGILFLSKNAVVYFFDRCVQLGIRWEVLQSRSRLIGAVGEATAKAIEARGLGVDYVSKNRAGEALARELGRRLAGKRVLLPRSDRGDARVLAALKEVGADVTEVVAYRTTSAESVDPKIVAQIRSGEVDVITFASPSAFQNLADLLQPDELASLSARVQLAAIGPTTAQAIRKAGAKVAIEVGDASSISAAGFADAIAKYYQALDSAPAPSARRA